MRTIRRKIRLAVILLIAAFVVSTVIYSRGGFSFAGDDSARFFCGTVTPLLVTDKVALNGEALFKANCTSCHAMERKITGPALSGMLERMPDTLIENFLLYPAQTTRRNTYLKNLKEEYGNLQHPPFLNILTKSEIEAMIRYFDFSDPPHIAEYNEQ